MTLDWLIIGGGIHGVHLAARLLGEAQVSPDSVRIVDPAEKLLDRWRSCTEVTGMTHLRSPSVHNLDLSPSSLLQFGGKRRRSIPSLFAPPYDRPALSLFDEHCDRVIERFEIDSIHIRDRAERCEVLEEEVNVHLAQGPSLRSKQIVLAVGASEQPDWPSWAPREQPRVNHVFEPGFPGLPEHAASVAVVGGGISACQVALRLASEGRKVHLVSRHAIRKHQFDSDPGWLGPKFMAGFKREQDVDRRREMIAAARHRGSISPDVARALHFAIQKDELSWHEGEVLELDVRDDQVHLRLCADDEVSVDHVLLATGFAAHRPGGSLVDSLVESASLPCASCGYPIVDRSLRWHPRVFVSGPLAELELGPTSRNIAGARRAADVLVSSLRGESTRQEVLSLSGSRSR